MKAPCACEGGVLSDGGAFGISMLSRGAPMPEDEDAKKDMEAIDMVRVRCAP